MSEIGKWIEELMAAGCVPKVAARVVTEVFVAGMTQAPANKTAEKRKEWDREYRRKKRASTRIHPTQVDMDATGKLWTEGVGLIRSLGISEKDARSNIGLWVKRGYDPAKILEVIGQATDRRTGDPIPWVTMGLKNERTRENRTNQSTGTGSGQNAVITGVGKAFAKRFSRQPAKDGDGVRGHPDAATGTDPEPKPAEGDRGPPAQFELVPPRDA